MVSMTRLLSFVAGVASLAVVIGILAITGVFRGNDNSSSVATVAPTVAPTQTISSSTKTDTGVDVAGVYARVSPGVVFVENDQPNGSSDSGSGFVIDNNGDIV